MTKLAPLLTPPEAAELLTQAGIPISGQALRQWIKAGHIPARRLPSGRLLIRREDIEAVISEPTATARSA